MPAINPARLKLRVTQLLELFDDPVGFVKDLHELNNFYADRTRKPGRGGPRLAQINAYNVPKQVLRQIEGMVAVKAAADPDASLELVDALWLEPWLECRLLAVHILGLVPPNPPERIIERMTAWGDDCGINHQLDSSLADGLIQLRKEAPRRFLRLLESWVSSPKISTRRLGLRVIPPLVSDSNFVNLPAIFNMISPLMQNADLITDFDLGNAVATLAKRSPQETAYFIKHIISISDRTGLDVFTRQILENFPVQVREDMRVFLRKTREVTKEQ